MLEAVVVGAGQAGLAMSQQLTESGTDHVVLERDRVAESWRTQRWDSFTLNTPGWYSALPGDESGPGARDGFATRDAFVAYLDDYAARRKLPIRTGVTVTAVRRRGTGFVVQTDVGDPIETRSVVVAAGSQRVPRIPTAAAGIPPSVTQLHSVTYRNAQDLPAGAVLVVGSAQSGVQVAEDLLDAGRTVYLATSRVGRLRRRYRGRDIFEWLTDAGFFAQTVATLPDPAMQFSPQPMISGIGTHGHTVSLQSLAQRGVRLLGHVAGADRSRLTLADDLAANIGWADARSADVLRPIDEMIAADGMVAPPPEPDPADEPHPDPASVHSPAELDFDAAGISTVVWTTGVVGDFSWLPPEARSADGRPIHTEGVGPIPGVYFIGLPWLRNRASGIISGVGPDAALLGDRIRDHLAAA